jgi:tetratricopeptide (TPR) repeat protein
LAKSGTTLWSSLYSELAATIITWANQTQQPETGFNIAKSWTKMVQRLDETSEHFPKSMLFLGLSLYELERFPAAFVSLKYCHEIVKKRPDFQQEGGTEHIKIQVLDALGECAFMLSNYDNALEYHKESLSLKLIKHGTACHPSIAESLECLSRVYQELNSYIKGLDCSNQSLAMLRTIHVNDLNHKEVAAALLNRANCLMVIGQLYEAIHDYTESLNIWRTLETFVQASTAMATLNSHLGHCYIILGNFHPGLESLETSLTAWQTQIDEEKQDTTTIKAYLWTGHALLETASYSRSLVLLDQGHAIAKAMFGDPFDHPLISEALSNLGHWYLENGEAGIGQKYLDDAYAMQTRVFEECDGKHQLMVKTLSGQAKIALMTGMKTEALKKSQMALEMAQELVPDSVILAEVLTDFAKIQLQNDNDIGAKASCIEAIKVWKSALGGPNVNHPGIAMTIGCLAMINIKENKLDLAQNNISASLDMLESVYNGFSIVHPRVAELLLMQGQVFAAQSQLEEATQVFKQALGILHEAFGTDSDHPLIEETNIFLNNLPSKLR